MRRRAVLVSSPYAGNALDNKQLATRLERVGITVAEDLLVSDLDHSRPQGAIWRARGYDLAIAAGGDGTIGSVATHLVGSGIPLGILPLGTANDVARSLHLPMDIEEAIVCLAGAVLVDIDIGEVIPGLTEPGAYSARHASAPYPREPSPVAGVCFMHAVTLGLNVEFARLATDALRRERLGGLTYAASALEAVARYRPVNITLRLIGVEGRSMDADTVIRTRAVQVCVVNAPVFGGMLSARLPGVSLQDRQLDFMVIEAWDAQQLGRAVQQLLAAIGGESDQADSMAPDEQNFEARFLPGVRRFRAQSAIIETSDAVDITLDGEIRTHTPVLVRVAPQKLRVLVSPQVKHVLVREKQAGEPDTETR